MFKLYRNYPVKSILQGISSSTSDAERFMFENILLAQTLGLMIFLASLLSVPLGIMWNITTSNIITELIVMIISSGSLYFTAQTKLGERLKRHIMSAFIFLAILTTYITFHEQLQILIWMILIILLLNTALSHSLITIYYLGAVAIIVITTTVVYNPTTNVTLDETFYIAFVAIFLFIIAIIIVINLTYRYIISQMTERFIDISLQKDEITALYEEVTATEEELREQNETITDLYDQLQANEEELRDQYEQLEISNESLILHQERLNFLAYKDTLTGLPNRKMILEQLDILANIQGDDHDQFALVFIDLDNFKNVNDTMGHSVGDELLVQISERMTKMIHKIDLLGRLGGDEFALLIRRNISEESLMAYLQRIHDSLQEPFKLANYQVNSGASFGVAIWPLDGKSSEDLLTAADTAMYKAKESGKNEIQFFRESMKQAILERIEMEYALIKAMENKEFYLEYQPLIDTATKKTAGFEALLRWQSPAYGRVPPLKFIPLAEDLGLIYDLGLRVIREVCKKIIELADCCESEKFIAINVSPLQFKNPDFLKDVQKILQETGVNPSYIEFEITESVFIDNIKETVYLLESIKHLGIHIAIDDFGTGYSSLNYILDLPIDTLKIDKSFSDKITSTNPKINVISGIISLAHSLGMKVVSEGIENEYQVNYLENNNCDIIQGYYFSKPLSEADMKKFLK